MCSVGKSPQQSVGYEMPAVACGCARFAAGGPVRSLLLFCVDGSKRLKYSVAVLFAASPPNRRFILYSLELFELARNSKAGRGVPK